MNTVTKVVLYSAAAMLYSSPAWAYEPFQSPASYIGYAIFCYVTARFFDTFFPGTFKFNVVVSIIFTILAVMAISNMFGTNPRNPSTLTYQSNYNISDREYNRLQRIFDNSDKSNPTRFYDLMRCKEINICNGVMAQVREERKAELAQNPDAFRANKKCHDTSVINPARYNCW